MAESEELDLIPETEAARDVEAEEKPIDDGGDDSTAVWVESGVEAAETEAEQATEEGERPPEEQEEPEQYTEEMAETSEETVLDVPETPAEEPAIAETPGEADIDEPAVLEPEREPSTAEDAESEPTTDMQGLEQNLTEFRRCIENIGTQLDDEMNRQDMRKLRAKIREKATRMENDLKERQKVKDQMDPQERIHLQQVIKQLDTQLNTYQELLERERAMTRRYPLVGVTVEDEETRAVNQAATPGQAQAMLKTNVKDREEEHVELMELERDILGLQDIQTDLAALVGEQADDVKLIEQNVEKAGNRVEHGHSQMQQSVGYSRASRKMLCVVGTIVACVATGIIILAVIVIAVILSR